VASWDTWGHPTTWQLSADQVKLEDVLRVWKRVKPSQTFDVELQSGVPTPRVEVTNPNGTKVVFEAGTAIQGNLISEIKRQATAQGTTVVTYKVFEAGADPK
jgi:hypothetical protein